MNHFCKEVPIIVVGCKTDLRKDRSLVKKLRKNRLEPVTYHRVGNPVQGQGCQERGPLGYVDRTGCQVSSTCRVWGKVGVTLQAVMSQRRLVFGSGT